MISKRSCDDLYDQRTKEFPTVVFSEEGYMVGTVKIYVDMGRSGSGIEGGGGEKVRSDVVAVGGDVHC